MTKKTLSKLIALLLAAAGGYFAYKRSPDFVKKIKQTNLQDRVSEKAENVNQGDGEDLSKVLGEETAENFEQRVSEEVRNVSNKIINSEVVKETKTQLNQIVEKKVEEIRELPEEQISKIKKDIKREICEELLKDE